VTVFRDGQAHVPKHLSKEQDIPLKAGDRVRVETPGGGGYGDPSQRDPELVRRDVAMGYYSSEEASALLSSSSESSSGIAGSSSIAQSSG
ncbi:MAG: hypothetical protein M3Y78_09920, partial [Pseudomonadota bacterium]|nr:hypothetical protein [Pseudomonadota bacterium]